MSGAGDIERAARSAPNPETVLPIVLLVDVSNSMNNPVVAGTGENGGVAPRQMDGTRLDHVLRALDRLPRQLRGIGVARRGGELAMITFGGGGVHEIDLRSEADRRGPAPTFVGLESAELPRRLVTGGHTPLAEALDRAIDVVRERNTQLAHDPHYRACVWLITDGQNTDAEQGYPAEIGDGTIMALRRLETDGMALLFTAMLPGADESVIARITPESTYPVAEADFARITQLIAGSSQSAADPGRPASAIYRRLGEILG